MIRNILFASIVAVLFSTQANAAVLIGWDFSGFDGEAYSYTGGPGGTYAGTGVAGASGGLFAGSGLNGVGTGNPVGAPAIADTFSANNWGASSLGDAISGDNYFQFTFSYASTSLESILLNLNRFSEEAPSDYAVYADVTTPGTFVEISSGSLDIGLNSETVDLSFISTGSTLTFRLYAYGSGDPEAVLGFQKSGDNSIVINGTEAVPEPSTYVLLLAGLGGVILIARSRRQKLVRVKIAA